MDFLTLYTSSPFSVWKNGCICSPQKTMMGKSGIHSTQFESAKLCYLYTDWSYLSRLPFILYIMWQQSLHRPFVGFQRGLATVLFTKPSKSIIYFLPWSPRCYSEVIFERAFSWSWWEERSQAKASTASQLPASAWAWGFMGAVTADVELIKKRPNISLS